MRRFLTFALAAALVLLGASTATAQHHRRTAGADTFQCGPPPPLTAAVVPLWQGVAGTVHLPITARGPQRDSVQAYFDQGLAWMYSYNFGEAVLSFRKAARFDPTCAMCFWGVATALGPNINEPIIARRWAMASAHVDTAVRLMGNASAAEQKYIRAAVVRFQPFPDTLRITPVQFSQIRQRMDQAYADSLQSIWIGGLRRDLTAGTLYAESQLNLHPWDWWNQDGTPKWPATSEAVVVARQVLGTNPRHVGAAHILIHALEASQRPDSALQAADILPSLMPGSAHLNHMPSHIYHRTGQYARSAARNAAAVKLDSAYLAFRGPEWRYPMYYAHDNEFLWVSASFVGQVAAARVAADSLMGIVTPSLLRCYSNAQHFLAAPGLVAMRFGQWPVIDTLRSPYPRYAAAYPRAMWHYTRGWAHLRNGRMALAEAARDSVFAIATSLPPDSSVSNNRTTELLGIAGEILGGEILAAQQRYDLAVDMLRDAVMRQDALRYDEPPPFFYPARHSLGAVLLQRGRPADLREAEAVYQTDLGLMDGPNRYVINRNRENGWAYRGMVNVKRAMGQDTTVWATKFRAVWDPRTPVPPGSRY